MRRWKDKLYVAERVCKAVDWIRLVQDGAQTTR